MARMTAREIRHAAATAVNEVNSDSDDTHRLMVAVTYLMQFMAETAAQLADHYELMEARAGYDVS